MKHKTSIILCSTLIVLKIFITYGQTNTSSECAAKYNCVLTSQETCMSCVNRNLTSIPKCASNIRSLNFSGNFILRLNDDDFALQLTQLEVLILQNISLKLIDKNAFKSLVRLRDLDLSINFLKSIHPETFSENLILERLNLSNNLFTKLSADQFSMPALEVLDLGNSYLEYISDSTFSNLTALKWLDLQGNKFTTLSIEPFSKCLQLRSLFVSGNPWICDCNFYSMTKIEMILQNNSNDMKCYVSDRVQKLWNETNFLRNICEVYFQTRKSAAVSEKITKDPNVPLIINIYGYVFIGISILIVLCCCCDCPNTNDAITVAEEISCQNYASTFVIDDVIIDEDGDFLNSSIRPTRRSPIDIKTTAEFCKLSIDDDNNKSKINNED